MAETLAPTSLDPLRHSGATILETLRHFDTSARRPKSSSASALELLRHFGTRHVVRNHPPLRHSARRSKPSPRRRSKRQRFFLKKISPHPVSPPPTSPTRLLSPIRSSITKSLPRNSAALEKLSAATVHHNCLIFSTFLAYRHRISTASEAYPRRRSPSSHIKTPTPAVELAGSKSKISIKPTLSSPKSPPPPTCIGATERPFSHAETSPIPPPRPEAPEHPVSPTI